MLNPSYAAMKQFQSQKSSIHSLTQLKEVLKHLGLSLSMQLSSSKVWVLDWDFSGDKVSGTLELSIQPTIVSGHDSFELGHPITFRLEQPGSIDLSALGLRLLEVIKQSVETIC